MAEQEAVSPPPEAQAPAAAPAAAGGGGEGEEVVEMFSKTFGIPKEVVAKALSRNETLERAQALIQLLGAAVATAVGGQEGGRSPSRDLGV